ncbi:MAG: DNA-processing protein DprA [Treponema sp.]|jgi:DNA processing protein|nr:DNA-processing protein DprA [Treponema sp.]
MNERGLLDLIISLMPGLAAKEKIRILNLFKCEEDILILSKEHIEEMLKRKINKNWDINDIRDKADRIDTICKIRSIKWVSYINVSYPPLLREIYDPPTVIFYKGILPDPEKPLLGMAGTRKPSPEGSAQAYKLAFESGKAGISVISGLALGIDSMAHRGNLASGVPGYAVLGSGVDEIFPSINRHLARQIIDSKGALISEYPPGVRPSKWSFPARNRIISALSRSVLIVEAPLKSGALITADFAHEHGKDLWTSSSGVKQGIYDKRGTIKLAQDGAEIIYSGNDILKKWNMKVSDNNGNTDFSGAEVSDIVFSMANFLKIEI